MNRIALFGLPFLAAILAAQASTADEVTFHAERYGCDLRVSGNPQGRVEPDKPLTISLERGREYLVECESHDIPVKLYARNYVGSYGPTPFQASPLPKDVTVVPVAVLPNVVGAAAAGKIDVVTVTESISTACKADEKDPKDLFSDTTHQIAPEHPYRIKKGRHVELTGKRPMHCGDTNLIEVVVDDNNAWFPNRDFSFQYNGKAIPLYPPSQDFGCCWIE
jgi:hypothetical protein